MPIDRARASAAAIPCRGLAVILLSLLSACMSAEDRATNEAKVAEARQAAGMREPLVKPLSRAEAETSFVGKTRLVNAADRGVQVSYMAADGSVYLWFPGNPVVLRGTWTFEETGAYRPYAGRPVSETSVCFTYGPGSVNAFDGKRGGTRCVPGAALATMSLERADGDVFGLSRKTEVPFVLPPERTTLTDLRKRAGAL
ncbi:hypothetical protein [Methylorubrum salsuginis]|uniref:Uncharacterized protein n=1 Tax=Methylorubrum salsuginis TaxID=414703 RepID=A0A1I4GQ84_9HYPH|nr:hypothetical protein [Methylorubrum salsuginis]SFL31653.1 hypothetical protein SAMN04488125_112160 [Methylorubrum salsuginis]